MRLGHADCKLPLAHADFKPDWLLFGKTALPLAFKLSRISGDFFRMGLNQWFCPFFMFYSHWLSSLLHFLFEIDINQPVQLQNGQSQAAQHTQPIKAPAQCGQNQQKAQAAHDLF